GSTPGMGIWDMSYSLLVVSCQFLVGGQPLSCSFSRILSWARFLAAISPLMLPLSGCWPLGWIFFGGGGTGLSVAPPTTCEMSPETPCLASNLAVRSGIG